MKLLTFFAITLIQAEALRFRRQYAPKALGSKTKVSPHITSHPLLKV